MIASRKALEPARYCLTGSELALVKHNRAVVHCPAWAGVKNTNGLNCRVCSIGALFYDYINKFQAWREHNVWNEV